MKYKIYKGGKLIHTFNEKHFKEWLLKNENGNIESYNYTMKYVESEYGYLWSDEHSVLWEIIAF